MEELLKAMMKLDQAQKTQRAPKLQSAPWSQETDERAALIQAMSLMNNPSPIEVGQLVEQRPGFWIANKPSCEQPFVVLRKLETPIYDEKIKGIGNLDCLQHVDVVLGAQSDDDGILTICWNSQFLQPWTGSSLSTITRDLKDLASKYANTQNDPLCVGDMITWKTRAFATYKHPRLDQTAIVTEIFMKPRCIKNKFVDCRVGAIVDSNNFVQFCFDSQLFTRV